MTYWHIIEMRLECDKCYDRQNVSEKYNSHFSVKSDTSWARSKGWMIGKKRCLCPKCNPRNKKEENL